MSEAGAYSFDAKLTVCIDFKSPQAYLAMDPTYALADELELEVDWLPLLVAPMVKPEAVDENAERGSRHRSFRAEYAERDIQRYADLRGLVMKDIYRPPVDSSLAAIGMLWVKAHAPEYLRAYMDRVFDGHWKLDLDIEDVSTIARVVEEVGADSPSSAAYFTGEGRDVRGEGRDARGEGRDVRGEGRDAHGEGRDALETLQTSLREVGLFNVPGYRVDEEIFFGRQHLPMIRWLLTGKQGHVPI